MASRNFGTHDEDEQGWLVGPGTVDRDPSAFDRPAEVDAILRVRLESFARSQEALQSKQRRGWGPSRIAPRGNDPEPIRFNNLKAAPAKECLHVPLRRWATGPPVDNVAQTVAQPGDAPSI
jgi:hypothetical protein